MAKGDQLNSSAAAVAHLEATETARSADEIRQDIAARRESITDTVDRLSDRFQQTFDWRTYVGNYPVVALGVAAGVGLLLSGIFKPRPTPTERMTDALADCVEDFTGHFRSQLDNVSTKRPSINQTVKAAATGLLVKAATEFVRNRVSGSDGQSSQYNGEIRNNDHLSQTDNIEQWNRHAPVQTHKG